MEKYYTPSIEDLFVGYECEVEWHVFNKGLEWRTTVIDLPLFNMIKSIKGTRTPYLTKEQIEAEGWKSLEDKSPFTGKPYKWRKVFGMKESGIFNQDKVYTLETHILDHRVKIHLEWESSWNRYSDNVFEGKCPSINEFKKLEKWLGINSI